MTGGFQSSIQILQQSVLDGNVQTLPLCLIVDSPLVREEKLQLSLHHCLYHFLAPDLIVFSLRLVSTKHSLISFNSSHPISAVGDDGDGGGDDGDDGDDDDDGDGDGDGDGGGDGDDGDAGEDGDAGDDGDDDDAGDGDDDHDDEDGR